MQPHCLKSRKKYIYRYQALVNIKIYKKQIEEEERKEVLIPGKMQESNKRINTRKKNINSHQRLWIAAFISQFRHHDSGSPCFILYSYISVSIFNDLSAESGDGDSTLVNLFSDSRERSIPLSSSGKGSAFRIRFWFN